MIIFKTTTDIQRELASGVKKLRLSRGYTQRDLAKHSGVKFGTIQKFEQTGQISLVSLINIAKTLNFVDALVASISQEEMEFTSMDQLLKKKSKPPRQRVRRK